MDITTLNRGDRRSFKTFEKDLLEEGLIRLRPFFKKDLKGVTVKDFIIKFLKDYNNNDELENISVDEEEVMCEQGRRRSGGDIFRLCKYYYPKTTLQEVLTILDDIVKADTKKEYKSQICSQINKRVFSFCGEGNGQLYHNTNNDEFNRKPGEYGAEREQEKQSKLFE